MTPSFALVTGLHWAAVLCYVAATFLVVHGAVFGNPRTERVGHLLVFPGLLLQAAGIVVWWQIAGHGPYIGRFEVLSARSWGLLVAYRVFLRFFPRLRAAAMLVYPTVFLMIALGLFFQPEIKQLPPTFRGIWLALHILFYNVAFGSIVIAVACSILQLVKSGGAPGRLAFLPDAAALDLHAYRFAGFGFIFWAIGMLAGSIWAYQSWNIFWNWDPVQVWALVTWVVFGIYLHLRRFFGWKGNRAAWLYLASFAAVVFSLFFTPVIESSIHAGYFK